MLACSLAQLLSGSFDRSSNARIGSATTDVPHLGFDFLIGGIMVLAQERGRHHHLARLAVTALRNIVLHPGFLDGMVALLREPLNGDDFRRPNVGNRCDTGLDGSTVEVNCTSPALLNSASILRTGEPQVIAEHPQERSLAGNVL